MTQVFHDVRDALRAFRRAPAFTATALLVLAIGIGSNVAVFTVVNALLFKPPGGRASGVLVGLYARERERRDSYHLFSEQDYRDIRDRVQGFSAVLAQRFVPVLVNEGDTARRSFAAVVSSNYFTTLAAVPAPGRSFTPAEDRAPAPVAIVSHAYWKRAGGTSDILGRTLRLDGVDFTVVGVAPAGFSGTMALFSPEFWLPLGSSAAVTRGGAPRNLALVGRLEPGVTRDEARALIDPVAAGLPASHDDGTGAVEILIADVSRMSAGAAPPNASELNGALLFLLAMSGLVLLAAALNLVNMLLARVSARRREVAIRLAIGARRGRIVRQLVTESLVLSLGGAALGTALAWAGTQMLAATLEPVVPIVIALDASPDPRVLTAAIAFAVASALAFGLGPAIALARTDLQEQLRAGTTATTSGRRLAARNLLVASQLALSLVLLSAAGLFVTGAWRAADADPGYPLDGGLVATIDPSAAPVPDARAFRAADVLERMRLVPGIQSASAASTIAFGVHVRGRLVRRAHDAGAEARYAIFTVSGAHYFSTLGIPLLRGREFSALEERTGSSARPVVVNEQLAQELWPDDNPIGRHVQFGDGEGHTWDDPHEVVGVARGVRLGLFDTQPVPQVFVPLAGSPTEGELYLHLRRRDGASEDAAMLQRVRRELRAAAPAVSVLSVVTLSEHRDRSIYLWMARASAQVFTWFGLAALALAALGVYGVKAFLVGQRTREFGIRMTLGATRGDIIRLVMADGAGRTASALGVALAVALALSRILASSVYGIDSIDVPSLAAALALLIATAALASYLPARHATALPPTIALRQE